MADYLNFAKIIPPKPNDPNVNLSTQINANWDLLDAKVNPYIKELPVPGTEPGQEYINLSGDFAVWTGSAYRTPDVIDDAWTAWTAIPVAAGRAARPSFTPRWRVNTALRMVELTGGFLFDGASAAWPMGTLTVLNGDVAGAIPATYTPIGGVFIGQAAGALTATTMVVVGCYIYVDKPGGNTFVRIRAQYMGGTGGGNFIQLDQVWWWY